MEKIVIANHKMHLTYKEIIDYLNQINDLNVIFFPSSIYIPYFIQKNLKTGIQNIYINDQGNYTGEISARQAKSIGISYALIGHAERRHLFNESNELINQKVCEAIKNNLQVILCVGEEQDQDYKSVIKKQLEIGLKNINAPVIIAYEPFWAIGNSTIPSIHRIEEVITYIKSLLNKDIKVVYGGSVSINNIKQLNAIKNLDGFIVGIESLDINKLKLIREVTN